MPRTLTDDIFFDPEYASEYTDDELIYLRDNLLDRISKDFGATAYPIVRNRVVAPIEAEIAQREAIDKLRGDQ